MADNKTSRFLRCLVMLASIFFLFGNSGHAQPAANPFPPITSLKVPDYVKVIDYTGRGEVPLGGALTPDPLKPIVIVIADELVFNNEEFDYCKAGAPRQIILIADTIHLNGYTKFYLSRRILPFDPQPPCASPYLSGPNLGQTLPPVLSVVTRNLIVGKEAGVCMFCKLEHGRFDTGSVTDASVESAARPSLTIAAEKVELNAKADFFIQTAMPAEAPATAEPVHTGWLLIAAIAPFLPNKAETLEQTSWGKPFFEVMKARPMEAPVKTSDLEAIRNFWKAGMKSAPEYLNLLWFTTVRLTKVEGTDEPSWQPDDLAFNDAAAFFSNTLSDAGRNDPQAVRGVSLWAVHKFQKLYLDLLEADRLEQRSEVLRLLRTFTSLPSYPVRPEHQPAYLQAVDAVKSIRDRYRNQLWRRAIQLDSVSSSPLSVDLFSEGAALETYMAPTQALVSERLVEGRRVLGTVRYVGGGQNPDIELSFSAELGVDPLVAEALKTKLGQGEVYSGQFSNWKLTAGPIEYPGVRPNSSVRVSDNTLQVTLRLDGHTGTLALWQLTSDKGIPVNLNYEYLNDSAQKGKLLAIPLSLARRKQSPIEVTPTGLRTTGTVPVTISYVKLLDGTIRRLQPQLTLNPGEVIAVPAVSAEQLNGLTVPPEAVSVNASEPYSLNDFDNAQQVRLTESITVKNVVPVTRIDRPGNLQRLELHIAYETAEGERQERSVVLAPAGITGSVAKLTFVRISQQGLREIRISGKAVYDNGTDTIAPQKCPAGDVVIDAEKLAAHSPINH